MCNVSQLLRQSESTSAMKLICPYRLCFLGRLFRVGGALGHGALRPGAPITRGSVASTEARLLAVIRAGNRLEWVMFIGVLD